MTNKEAISRMKLHCCVINEGAKCKGDECNNCEIKLAIEALEKIEKYEEICEYEEIDNFLDELMMLTL